MKNLLDETRLILKKYGIVANKKLGQNFLINETAIHQIVESAEISEQDFVIEIGPGLGTLTQALLEKAGKVVAIELDKKMVEVLTDRFQLFPHFTLINEDVLKVDLEKLIEENTLTRVKIVANLPYYITTPIIMKLLEDNLKVESITVMIQKEVADRLLAIPGGKNTGAITYSVYDHAEVSEVLKVMPNSFLPEPSVESKVIQLKLRKNRLVEVQDEALMFRIIQYAFMQRRKTFVNALEKSNLFHSKAEIIQMLKKLGINEQIRGEALSLTDYANITNFVMKM